MDANDNSKTILTRLESLERQNRWLKRGGAFIVLLVGVGLLLGADDKQKSGSTEGSFSLKDANGKQRAWIGMTAEGPVFRFLNEAGQETGRWESGKGGMTFRLLDNRGRFQSGFSLEPTGMAVVAVNGQGKLFVGRDAIKADAGLLAPNPPNRATNPARP